MKTFCGKCADDVYSVTDTGIYGFFKNHRFLSNFHLCSIDFEGFHSSSVEAAFQAAKILNVPERKYIASFSPISAKKVSRRINMRTDWSEVKVDIMYQLLKRKFTDFALREKLLATGDKYLEETNWWGDTFWGVDFKTKEGENQLGKLLMRVRSELIK